MVILWFSYDFPIFLWFSYGFLMVFHTVPGSMLFFGKKKEPSDSAAGIIEPADLKRLLAALRAPALGGFGHGHGGVILFWGEI